MWGTSQRFPPAHLSNGFCSMGASEGRPGGVACMDAVVEQRRETRGTPTGQKRATNFVVRFWVFQTCVQPAYQTRQILLPLSSEKSNEPSGALIISTGRPQTSPLDLRKPETKSEMATGFPF